MKILAAKFKLESNAHVAMKCDMENTILTFGQAALDNMQVGSAFSDSDVEVIPVLCADAGCSGVMTKECFDYIAQRLMAAVRDHLSELDGIYLHLHGASYVEKVGSGNQELLRQVRQIVGPYLPIAVSCDPHGNLTQEYVANTNLIRSYRQTPHTDIDATVQTVCRDLVQMIREHQTARPEYRKLPLILGGEQSVSADEPVRSINKKLDEIEADSRILSASWHVGYLRHDCPEAGCGIVVVPVSKEYQAYASGVANELVDFIWQRRHEFHYTGLTAAPKEALNLALASHERPNFITDSGDNVTSGAEGKNTVFLNRVLTSETTDKHILFAAINDSKAYAELSQCAIGENLTIKLGDQTTDLTPEIQLNVIVKAKGTQTPTLGYGESGDYGGCVTVSVMNSGIDIIVTDNNHRFVEHQQMLAAGVDWNDYDVIVVKTGYAFPEIREAGHVVVMALTPGATQQDTTAIPFKLIMRPMFPIDQI